MTPEMLSGALRVYAIIGDPVAQVKSPAGVTQALRTRGHDAIVVPFRVPPAGLRAFFAGLQSARNVDGAIVTVPHKFAACDLCARMSARARFLGAVNAMRRTPDGAWEGDMFDGLGYVSGMRQLGCDPRGKRVLLVGAGGAGTAMAHALVEAGVAMLAIHDENASRRDALVARLAALDSARVEAGGPDPAGMDVVLNATPAGMRARDPLPVATARLTAAMFVGDVVTAPVVTPLLVAARARGCTTMTGADMFAQVRDLMVDFFVAGARDAG